MNPFHSAYIRTDYNHKYTFLHYIIFLLLRDNKVRTSKIGLYGLY